MVLHFFICGGNAGIKKEVLFGWLEYKSTQLQGHLNFYAIDKVLELRVRIKWL